MAAEEEHEQDVSGSEGSEEENKKKGPEAEWIIAEREQRTEENEEYVEKEDGEGEIRRRTRRRTKKTRYVQDTGDVDTHCNCSIM